MSARHIEQALPVLTQLLPPLLVQQVVGTVLNRVLAPALAANALAELQGRWLAIDCREFAYPIRISRTPSELSAPIQSTPAQSPPTLLVSTRQGPTDASIRGDLAAFLSLLRQDCDPDTLFFQRKLVMQGDTELALSVKNFLDTVDRDQLPVWLRKPLGM
ncbi:hypothetical protein HPT27_12740 [Permianibacter sp. IMCC34836]|uniref:ubiquinone anaerobic biosynthesis accessory factor UbiT n=1 Tax=Permianibacter fluminis TaxID=2738515 RepID=UPI00155252AD|nr:SCP2 sterol-binding domain-containing protein [Permianibacter fluminis]NQD37890.1 hypothetical protein [Permianibacter fluminis]